eukprot:TRINITY_DN9876_c0_g1_i1.p2 TRINITY_DN9876_c0_g1~~TRINITY_DN9876_c0_g1_i1.p2  ORF type:complete len:163 (+),score=24.04 TRINITY_DN9876_c0_g1_i1:537-1025(+)
MGDEEESVAVAKLVCNDGGEGEVWFRQNCKKCPTRVSIKLRGLVPGLHGFHIHEFGDTTLGCGSSGGHFNPYKVNHGGRKNSKKNRHVGDLGNVEVMLDGNAEDEFDDELLTLNGQHSIIGRTVVIHSGEDDLGIGGFPDSKTTGHAGPRVCCGVIGRGKSS